MRRALLISLLAALAVPASAPAKFSISAESLRPDFSQANTAYTVRCAEPVRLRVSAGAAGAPARIAGGARFEGVRSPKLALAPSQAVVVRKGSRRYTVRCVPEDFPAYRYAQSRPGRVGLFAVTPLRLGELAPLSYVVVFNRHGAPVWWLRSPERAIDAKTLDDGTIAFSTYYGGGYGADPRQAYRLIRLDGSLITELRTVGAPTDHHDVIETKDGNYLILAYKVRGQRVDATAFNGDPSAQILDSMIQKLSPDGRLLWRWNSRDHVRLAETARWWPGLTEPYDVTHINSVAEMAGGDLLISLRHTDAVYRIDEKTGEVVWKLGGTATSRSLSTALDPNEPLFGGQHDARQLADGTITVFDNGTDLERPPRAVRYRITGDTARLIAQIREPFAPRSRCCGSARRLPGSWLASWGGTGIVSAFKPGGARIFTLDLLDQFSYRAAPLTGVGEGELIEGMNKRHPPLR